MKFKLEIGPEDERRMVENLKSVSFTQIAQQLQIPKGMLDGPVSPAAMGLIAKLARCQHGSFCSRVGGRKCPRCGRTVCRKHFHRTRCEACVDEFVYACRYNRLDTFRF